MDYSSAIYEDTVKSSYHSVSQIPTFPLLGQPVLSVIFYASPIILSSVVISDYFSTLGNQPPHH